MANFELSEYQKNILNFVANDRGNLLVDAKAGSGKTTTLIMIANEIAKKNNKCLFLAFNKAIVADLQAKVPSEETCMVRTVHSLGYKFIQSHLFKKYQKNYVLNVDEDRLRNYVKEYYDENYKGIMDFYNATGSIDESFATSEMVEFAPNLDDKELKELHNKLVKDFKELCVQCRNYNVNYKTDSVGMKKIVEKFCPTLNLYIDDVFPDYMKLPVAIIDKLKEEFENPKKNTDGKYDVVIDYNDMIYFPVYYNMTVPSKVRPYMNTVLVDEAQDLSVLEQKFVYLLNNNFNRFIFVGDERQSIYAFAGADTQAIGKLKDTFVLKHLPLNICYRCPENVIRLAKGIVPSIEWNKARTDAGMVKFVTMDETVKCIRPGDVIIGRRNKDLVLVFRHFTLDLKRQIKFKNIDLVRDIVNDIERAINLYIKRYTKGLNIEVPLLNHMKDWYKEYGYSAGSKEYTKELEKYSKALINANKEDANRQVEDASSLTFLKTCMKEYKELGDYDTGAEESVLVEYFDIVENFMSEYINFNNINKHKQNLDVQGLINYITSFLSGTLNKELPIISSVHQMKGGEADNVYIYNYPCFPYTHREGISEEDILQEENIQYVAITRAKKNLYLMKLENTSNSKYAETLNDIAESNVRELLNRKLYM